jgi:hypothetical protein
LQHLAAERIKKKARTEKIKEKKKKIYTNVQYKRMVWYKQHDISWRIAAFQQGPQLDEDDEVDAQRISNEQAALCI